MTDHPTEAPGPQEAREAERPPDAVKPGERALCRESVSVVGEIATCVLAKGHQGKHDLVWEGDPEVLARKIGRRYIAGLKELRSRLIGLADDLQADIDGLSE